MKKEVMKLTVWTTLFIILAVTTFIITDDNNEKTKKIENEKLFELKKEDIQKIQINTANSKVIAKKEKEQWIITKPKIYKTEERNISTWIDKFSSITPSQSFEAKNTLDFGIANKQQPDFYAWDADDKKYTITVGDKTPDETKYYIKTNQNNKTFTVNADIIEENGLDSSLKKLRNKDFLKIRKDNVSSITYDNFTFKKADTSIAKLRKLPGNIKLPENINYETKTQVLKYKGEMEKEEKEKLSELSEDKEYKNAINKLFNKANKTKWTITNIKDKEIDINKTSSFIETILRIKASDFTEDTKISFNDKESLVFEISRSDRIMTLNLSAYKDKVYAKIKDENNIYEIQKHLFDRLNKNESDFILKEIKEKKEKK